MSIKKPIVINFLSGPGNLKSGIASGVFSLLKLHYVRSELVTEFPKDLTWEKNWALLDMQSYIFGEQNRRLARIQDEVDVIVTDTSLLFSLVYRRTSLTEEFENYVMSVYNSYNNLNIVLTRNESAEYEDLGRAQSESEAITIDNIVESILVQHDIDYTRLEPDYNIINKIVSMILARFNKQMKYRLEALE